MVTNSADKTKTQTPVIVFTTKKALLISVLQLPYVKLQYVHVKAHHIRFFLK